MKSPQGGSVSDQIVIGATHHESVLLDQAVSAAAALIVAASLRRIDIVFGFPAFAVLRVLGCVVLLQTFWAEIIRQRTLQTWFSVGRYEINEQSKHAIVHAPLD